MKRREPTLGERILEWATFAQRPLAIDELSDALGNHGLLEPHKTIGDLCGGFLVVDHEGRVALIHETAREYLSRNNHGHNHLVLERKATHDKLFRRCVLRLMDKMLRAHINQSHCPALLDYAASEWAFHLSRGSATGQENLEILIKFFQGPSVLTWIQAAARGKLLRSLVGASRRLGDIVERLRRINDDKSLLHCKAIDLLTRWATDLIKLVGKFGMSLLQRPDSIYKLIPPFCPENSAIYQQFGRKETKSLHVSGFTRATWDDCLARLSLTHGVVASSVSASGGRIFVLTNRRKSGCVFVYNSVTFEEELRIAHPERIFKTCVGRAGTRLLTYGYKTTKIWNLPTGDCMKKVANPAGLPRPKSIIFLEMGKLALMGSEDRGVRVLRVDGESTGWDTKAQIEEYNPAGVVLNAPICSALSPDGEMIAFGYRGHPVTVWQVSSEELVGRCNMTPDGTGVTVQETTMGEITQLAWHPFSGEVFGLQREGLLFKWDPYDDDASDRVQTGAQHLAVSLDGSLVVTGDARGTVKVYTTADFSLLYQLSSQDPVLDISFSADSRRLYDIRGAYGNVWEPNALVCLAESSEFTDHSSDAWGDSDALTKQSVQTGQHFPGVDSVMTVSGQPTGSLYCYGTGDGLAVLGEVGHGTVCEVERAASFMAIEKVAWSDDGSLVATADLSRRLSVKTIVKANQAGQRWQVKDKIRVNLSAQRGFDGLLFQPKGRKLLAVSPTALFCLDLESHAVLESTLPDEDSKMKWMCHPTRHDYLLAFGVSKCYVYTWEDLTQAAVHHYHTPTETMITTPTSAKSPSDGPGSFGCPQPQSTVGRLTCYAKSTDILLEICQISSSGRLGKQYLLFSADDIQLGTEKLPATTDDTQSVGGLTYILLPPEISSRIREPLAILSRRRLLFLDADRWICTWRIQTVPQPRRGSEQGTKGIDAHYFLPGDWVTSKEAHLCTALADGTLLCTKNGEVGAVQCAKIRRA